MTLTDLKLQRRWVLWRLEMVRNNRGELVATKVPYQLDGRHASSTDPASWCSHAEAQAAVGSYTGTGVMMGAGLGCTDLDHCVVNGQIMPWARAIIIALNSYSEFSPTMTGVHVLATDISLPGKGRKRPYEGGAVEIYDTARFLTFTGKWLPKTPAEILSRRSQFNSLYEQIDQPAASRAPGNRDFDLLWAGDWEKAGFPSQSEAVFVLCQLLNARHNNDAEKVDADFRASGLFSGKWADEKWARLGLDTIQKTRKDPEVFVGSGKPKPPAWKVENFSQIVREEIDWLFEGYAARGKITGLSGEPDAGKSLLALDWGSPLFRGPGLAGRQRGVTASG